ncbi:GIY-YIG nuclease family protein [Sphingomonas sp. ZB1N12]|uniref:GIY-YIG nuclease family protein n=1 Tax=Sphingomonas arabinosi TaxID=3096160 RepID=UPI002FC904DE
MGATSQWSQAETILAFDVAVRNGRTRSHDPSIRDLSRRLREVGDESVAFRHRNTHGVMCKVNRLVDLIERRTPSGGARLEKSVFDEFAGRPKALATAVAEANTLLAAPPRLEPSRGPPPAFGKAVVVRHDGPTYVYLARLHGVVLDDGRLLAKIGRSAQVARRMSELNGGLPAPLGVRWQSLATWQYRDAIAAHLAEQDLLARCAADGCSAGGEFLAISACALDGIVEAGPRITGRSDRQPSPNGRVRRGSRAARRTDRAPRRD